MSVRINRVPSIELALAPRAPREELAARAGDADAPAAGDEQAPDHGEIAAVWRLLRHLGVADRDADDAAQQVFLVVAERRSDIEVGKRRAFVYGTALRIAQAFTRKSARQMVELDEEAIGASDVPLSDELLDRERARQLLEDLLTEMPFDLRAVFVLFEIVDLSTDEIAEALGLARGTVASRLRRARQDYAARVARLRAKMTRRGVEP